MTRGQESLIMDVETAPQVSLGGQGFSAGALDLIVLAADAEEIAAHEKQLGDIDKASKGKCVWRSLESV